VINIKNDQAIKAFGERLRVLRVSKKMSQKELANLADIEVSQVSRIERGVTNLTLSTMYILAAALDIPVSEFFTG
jgi:transcriptional regulator with XRE-family HTH domain